MNTRVTQANTYNLPRKSKEHRVFVHMFVCFFPNLRSKCFFFPLSSVGKIFIFILFFPLVLK